MQRDKFGQGPEKASAFWWLQQRLGSLRERANALSSLKRRKEVSGQVKNNTQGDLGFSACLRKNGTLWVEEFEWIQPKNKLSTKMRNLRKKKKFSGQKKKPTKQNKYPCCLCISEELNSLLGSWRMIHHGLTFHYLGFLQEFHQMKLLILRSQKTKASFSSPLLKRTEAC